MPPHKGTSISLSEGTPQHFSAPPRSTSYGSLCQNDDYELNEITPQHSLAPPGSTLYNLLHQNDDELNGITPQPSLAAPGSTYYDPFHQNDEQLNEITRQHSSASAQSTSYDPLPQNDDDELNESTPQHPSAPPPSTSHDTVRQDNDDEQLLVPPKKTWFGMARSWWRTVVLGEVNEITSQHPLLPLISRSYDTVRQNDNDEHLQVPPEKTWFGMAKSWRSTVALNAVLAGLVLLVNLGFFVYMVKLDGFTLGFITIFTGTCGQTKQILIGVELLINVLSTLLLGASNNCTQVLSSPERTDIDKAHQSGTWLELGVPSFRNLWYVSKWRGALCLILLASSIPLHLLFNSAIILESAKRQTLAALATKEFVAGSYSNQTSAPQLSLVLDLYNSTMSIQDMSSFDLPLQMQNDTLKVVGNAQCLTEYESVWKMTGLSNLLIVTNANQQGLLIVTASDYWTAGVTFDNNLDPCVSVGNSTTWQMTNIPEITVSNSNLTSNWTETYNATVEYCFVERYPPPCRIKGSPMIFLMVMLSNLVKLACLVIVLCQSSFKPLATVGDAISSFLEDPDSTTKGLGPISCRQAQKLSRPFRRSGRVWEPDTKPCAFNVGFVRCLFSWGLGMLVGTGNVVFLISSLFQSGGSGTLFADLQLPILANVILANTPQLALTVLYFPYNHVWTCMLAGREITAFANQRKSLRTSAPKGKQRSTYFLQLPYRYSVPILVASIFNHWTVSQMFYLTETISYDIYGRRSGATNEVNYAVYSATFPSMGLIWSLLFLLLPQWLYGGLHYEDSIPTVGTCSLAISAACHPDAREKHPERQALRYGVIARCRRDSADREHVGFSSWNVLPLKKGVEYY